MRRPSPATIIASFALFFSLAGTGLAASKYLITSTKQIKPSVLSSLHGSQGPRGPQGVQGAVGPAGAAGAAGAAGGAGPTGTFTTSDVTTVIGSAPTGIPDNGGNATSIASCPSGSTVIGGGYTWAQSTPPDVTVSADVPQGTTAWVVTIQNNSTTTATGAFVAEALCAS
jgi:hypothetical protein